MMSVFHLTCYIYATCLKYKRPSNASHANASRPVWGPGSGSDLHKSALVTFRRQQREREMKVY